MSKSFRFRVAALALATSFAANAFASDVTGAGASFVYPAVSKWSSDYKTATGKEVNYQSIGSGGGIAQIKAGTVDFGSSDAPLKPEELAKHGLAQFPSVIGGVVPVINVAGVKSGAMKLESLPSASALSSGSARCSAVPTSVWMPGSAFRSASSIAASGSTAITSVPCSAVISATTRVSLPVPAPMSTTRGWAPTGSSSHATASAG